MNIDTHQISSPKNLKDPRKWWVGREKAFENDLRFGMGENINVYNLNKEKKKGWAVIPKWVRICPD